MQWRPMGGALLAWGTELLVLLDKEGIGARGLGSGAVLFCIVIDDLGEGME